MSTTPDRQLVEAALAIQRGLATSEQVLDAARVVAARRAPTLAHALEASGVLSSAERGRLDALVDEAARVALPTRTAPDTLDGDPTLTGSSAPRDEDATLDSPRLPVSWLGPTLTPEHPGRYGGTPGGPLGAEVLGQGGVGRVLRGFDRHLGREVAIKELLGGLGSVGPSGSPHISPTLARFVREARITAQLEHPSIVPVHELGVRPDGTLYYTMKRVRGRTLEQAIGEAASLDQRLRLVAPVLDLCHAVAYAHARGVIHRDIKPANVMVGEFGETIVLDWGLARLRGGPDPDGRHVRLPDDDGSDPGRTVAGAAFGTPTTMSPEQARGDVEAVDERSDVWSLGAVLFHLLTGRPPFVGASAHAVIVQAQRDAAPPVRSLEPGAPAELAAIAERALSRDPEARYPSAGAMARDLDAWTTGRRVEAHTYTSWEILRRFVGQHRTSVVVTALAAVILLAAAIGTHLRVRDARDRAAKQRDAARQFASYLVNEVSEDIASLPGAGAIRKEVLTRALAYYEDAGADQSAPPEEQRNLAVGTLRIGELAMEAGELEVAERAYERAEPILRALRERSPKDPDALLDMAEWAEDQGGVAQARGQDGQARSKYQEALALGEAVLEAHPRRVKAMRTVARATYYLGLLRLATGPTDQAGPLLSRSAALELQILEALPGDETASTNAVHSQHSLAKLELVRGRVDAAVSALERGLAVGEARMKVAPHDADAQMAMIESLSELSSIALSQGQTVRAVERGREALATAERLQAEDPWSAVKRRTVSAVQQSLAWSLAARGEREEARALAQRSLETQEALLLQEPTSASARREVTVALHALAGILDGADSLEEARALNERALVLHRELLAEEPGSVERARDLSVTLGNLGRILWKTGDRAGATARYREVLDSRVRLLADDPDNKELQRDAALTLTKLATLAQEEGRLDEAWELFARGLTALRALSATNPADVTASSELAQTLEAIAGLAYARGDYEGSLDAYEEALGISDELMAGAEAAQIGRRKELLVPYSRAYGMAAWLGQTERARALAERARRLGEELHAQSPDDVQVLEGLQLALQTLGDHDRYLGVVRALQSADADVPAHAVELIEALVLAGHYAEALKARADALAAADPCTPMRPVARAWSVSARALGGDGAGAAQEALEAASEEEPCPSTTGGWVFVGAREALAPRGPAGAAAAALIASLDCGGQPGCDTFAEAFRRFAQAVAPALP